jgi:hypothetical protein
MSDLAKRLRRWGNDEHLKTVLMGADEDMLGAADLIERLKSVLSDVADYAFCGQVGSSELAEEVAGLLGDTSDLPSEADHE